MKTSKDIMTDVRRIGTLQTQSEEVQLASIHKESYQEIIYNQNKLGSGLSDIISKSALLSRWPMQLLPGQRFNIRIGLTRGPNVISNDLTNCLST